MKSRKPSRILNERSILLGLGFADLIGLALTLLTFQLLLKPFRREFFALVLTFFVGVGLSSLRLRYRRNIIRDALSFLIAPKTIKKNRREK